MQPHRQHYHCIDSAWLGRQVRLFFVKIPSNDSQHNPNRTPPQPPRSFGEFVFAAISAGLMMAWFAYDATCMVSKMSPDEYMQAVVFFYTDIISFLSFMFLMCACLVLGEGGEATACCTDLEFGGGGAMAMTEMGGGGAAAAAEGGAGGAMFMNVETGGLTAPIGNQEGRMQRGRGS